jgi:hypothetical protein
MDNSILWTCLDDDVDDAVLIDLYGGEVARFSESRAIQILHLRRNILRHLRQNIIQLNSDNSLTLDPEKNAQHSLSLLGVSRVFRMAISLTPCLNTIGQVRRTIPVCHYC